MSAGPVVQNTVVKDDCEHVKYRGTQVFSPPPACEVSTDLIELVGTLPAQVVLTRQDDHRFVEELQADGADQLFLQTLQRRLTFFSPASLQVDQVCR